MPENQDNSTINNRGSTKADGKKYCETTRSIQLNCIVIKKNCKKTSFKKKIGNRSVYDNGSIDSNIV